MSLIQQALERAKSVPHTAALEREKVEIKRPVPISTPVPAPTPVLRIATPIDQEEEIQLRKFEKKIHQLNTKTTRQKSFLKWTLVSFYLAAILMGIGGIYFWMRGFNAPSTPLALEKTPGENPKVFVQTPATSKDGRLLLTGITNSGGVRYALVNNQVVTIGDMLKNENALVKDIHERSVILEQNGRPMTLTLDSNS